LALIELDLTAQPDHPPTSIPPVRRYRTPGLVLALLLLLVLGGAAAPGALHWSYLGAVPAPPLQESPFQLGGDQLFTVGGGGDGRTVTAWTLAKPPVRRWSLPFPARAPGPSEVAFGDVRVRRAGDIVLLTDGPRTTAVDDRSGAVRWQANVVVRPLPGDRIGLVQEPQFRPGTEYDQDSIAAGEVFFSATGVPHSEPPIRTDLRGVDLRTGDTVWSGEAAGAVATYLDAAGVLVLESNRLTLRAIDTGAVLRTTTLSRLDGQDPDSGRPVGDVMLVSYGTGDSAKRRLVGYSMRTFRQLWQVPEARVLTNPGVCLGLVCADDGSGEAVLDPLTGRARWHAAGLDLVRRGASVLESGTGTTDAVRLADVRNGDERLPLTGWHADLNATADAPAVIRRTDESGASVFALADDDPVVLRSLGATHGPVADCAVDDRFVVCRATAVLQVFEFRR